MKEQGVFSANALELDPGAVELHCASGFQSLLFAAPRRMIPASAPTFIAVSVVNSRHGLDHPVQPSRLCQRKRQTWTGARFKQVLPIEVASLIPIGRAHGVREEQLSAFHKGRRPEVRGAERTLAPRWPLGLGLS